MVKNTEKMDSFEVIWDDEIKDELDELEEKVDSNISLSEIWEYDNVWHFVIKEEIKWKDEKGDYIEIRWNKYYDWNWNGDGEWLWYDLRNNRVTGEDTLYIWHMKWKLPEWNWTEFYWLLWRYTGDRKDGTMDGNGYRKFSDGSTFNWLFKEWFPVTWKLEKYKNWKISYTYEWGIDQNWKFQWPWIKIWESWHIYEWDWKDWKYDWHGILTYPSWTTLEWDWIDDNFKEWYWIEIKKNGEKYEWDFLLDKNGQPKPFCYINEDKDINVYRDWKERLIQEWNTQPLSEINMRWKRTFPNGNYHEFKLTNWSISEKSNDFITMYGDNKPDENRSAERWNIEYTVNYSSESHIEYRMASRKKNITRKLEWWSFKFENKKWETLSIPKVSDVFEERDAMHAANLINSVRHINENAHGNRAYRYDENNLYATTTVTHWYASWWGIAYHEYTKEANGTALLNDVKKHFWWISAKTLADRLNGWL